jgi:hypothetical protein
MFSRLVATAVGVAALLAGCTPDSLTGKFERDDELALAKRVMTDLQAGNLDAVANHMVPEMKTGDGLEKLKSVAAYFPHEPVKSIAVMGVQSSEMGSKRVAVYSLEYELDHSWVTAVIRIENRGQLVVAGLHLNKTPESLRTLNAFTFRNKSIIHVVFLLAAILIPILMVVAAVMAIRTRELRHRWWWAIFALVGLDGMALNWTTGAIGHQLMAVHLLGVGAVRGGEYAPWIVTISLPVGAIAVLVRRRKLKSMPPPVPTEQPERAS